MQGVADDWVKTGLMSGLGSFGGLCIAILRYHGASLGSSGVVDAGCSSQQPTC